MWNQIGGEKVEDKLAPAWPGTNPVAGSGIAGKVEKYERRPSKKGKDAQAGTYGICTLAGAVTFVPNAPNGDAGKLYKHDTGLAIIVGAWLERTLNPDRIPAGSYVQVNYLGTTDKGAKMYEVRTIGRDGLARLWSAAEPAPADQSQAPQAQEGDDDLPF